MEELGQMLCSSRYANGLVLTLRIVFLSVSME